jgi:hypothetical protein
MFQTFKFYFDKQDFTFKFFSSDKFGFASNIWACLSANITIHNVIIGITLDFKLFSFRTQTFISILLSSMLHQTGQFRNQLIQPVIFSESIAPFKRPENQSRNLN